MREMKKTGIPWIPELASDFSVGFVKHYFFVSKDLSDTEEPERVLKLARSGIVEKDVTTNEGQMAASYAGYNKVQVGDLLLNPMDLYSGANCNVSELNGVISPAYSNLRAKKTGTVVPKYYDYYFKSQYWLMAMFAHGKGVSFDNRWTLNNDSLKSYEIPVIPFGVQQKIVKHIQVEEKKVDTLISNNEAQIEKLKAYKQSLITEVVTKGLDPTVPMKDSGVEWIGEIPEHWKIIPLKTMAEYRKGLPITKADLCISGIPVISYGQIHSKENSGTHIDNNLIRFVSPTFLDSNLSSLGNYGDLFFADTSEDYEGIGNAVYIDTVEDIFAGYHTIIVHPIIDMEKKYLAYLCKSECWRSQLRAMASGIKVYSVTQNMLKKVSVVIPFTKDQKEIVDYLDTKCAKIDNLISIKQAKIEKLNQYKKSLIYEYVTGKKEVQTNG